MPRIRAVEKTTGPWPKGAGTYAGSRASSSVARMRIAVFCQEKSASDAAPMIPNQMAFLTARTGTLGRVLERAALVGWSLRKGGSGRRWAASAGARPAAARVRAWSRAGAALNAKPFAKAADRIAR